MKGEGQRGEKAPKEKEGGEVDSGRGRRKGSPRCFGRRAPLTEPRSPWESAMEGRRTHLTGP